MFAGEDAVQDDLFRVLLTKSCSRRCVWSPFWIAKLSAAPESAGHGSLYTNSTGGGQLQMMIAASMTGRGRKGEISDVKASSTTSGPSRVWIVGSLLYLRAPECIIAQNNNGLCR